MEPITILMTALALGATAALQETAKLAVNDAYTRLKKLISTKYRPDTLVALERKPNNIALQEVTKEELVEKGCDQDHKVIELAYSVIEEVQMTAPEIAQVVGVRITGSKSEGSITIEQITSTGHGVIVEDAQAGSDITIRNVNAGDIR